MSPHETHAGSLVSALKILEPVTFGFVARPQGPVVTMPEPRLRINDTLMDGNGGYFIEDQPDYKEWLQTLDYSRGLKAAVGFNR